MARTTVALIGRFERITRDVIDRELRRSHLHDEHVASVLAIEIDMLRQEMGDCLRHLQATLSRNHEYLVMRAQHAVGVTTLGEDTSVGDLQRFLAALHRCACDVEEVLL
jgi:hypothetical protein